MQLVYSDVGLLTRQVTEGLAEEAAPDQLHQADSSIAHLE